MIARRIRQRLFYGGLFASLALLLAGWWLGSAQTLLIPGGRLIALGRLFGLLATYTILLEVLLMSRVPFFEETFDLHETVDLHRWNGYGILFSLTAHAVFITLGYAAPGHVGLWHQFVLLNTQYEDVLIATLGTIIFLAATSLSVGAMRRKLPHEVWFAAHLTLYVAILMTTLHQLKTGGDFIGHFWFTAYWYMWYIGVVGLLVWYRFGRPLLHALRYQFRVERVVPEGRNTYSVYVSGRNLTRFTFRAGQYATWWLLAPGMWWQSHPFSFSGQPGQPLLRFTVKGLGDFSTKIRAIRPGTRLIIDGPRGAFTTERADDANNVLLIAGGIGVGPYLSTIGNLLDAGKTVTLLYAVADAADISFRDELRALRARGLRLELFVSTDGRRVDENSLAPHVGPGTVAYICGPDGMSRSLTRTLRQLGMPKQAIATERFAY